MGDANLDAMKWNDPKFVNKNVAIILRNTLKQCGMVEHNIGVTFVADHSQANLEVAQSALDHVYSSEKMCAHIQTKILKNSSSDHVPVIASFKTNQKIPILVFSITKRSQKYFSKERWNNCLAKKIGAGSMTVTMLMKW